LHASLTTVSKKSALAVAARDAPPCWTVLTRCRDVGHEPAAATYDLLGTAQINEPNVEAYLRYVLERPPAVSASRPGAYRASVNGAG
jgi:hypothetical protein